MHGLIGKMNATPGQRDLLISILLEGTAEMPGCLSYIVAKDSKDENGIWISEVWDSKESHAGSLKLPSVQQAIARARPLIAGMGRAPRQYRWAASGFRRRSLARPPAGTSHGP